MVLKRLTLVALTALLATVLFRALVLFKPPPAPEQCSEAKNHTRIKLTDAALSRFKRALNIRTISYKSHEYEAGEILKLISLIETSFPLIHQSRLVKREIVANYTLIYTVTGKNQRLRPYMLTSHMDVVPAVLEKWSSDPFEAVLKDDKHLYARGTIDAKHLLMSMLEAFETMLKDGFVPERSFYLVFGHDEETGGLEGALTVAQILNDRIRSKGWDKLEFVLDEGNIISKTPVLGVNNQIGLIGVSEKGYVTVKVSATGSVGHGSMPPDMTAISKLSGAVAKFHSHLFPSYFGEGVEREMLEIFARYASWPYKIAYANLWLFNPIFEYVFSSDPTMNSFIRTSTAVTMVTGGTKENVLPDSAHALINHRIHPKQTVQDVLDYDLAIIDDPTIQVEIGGAHWTEPTPVAPYGDDSYGYQMIKRSVQEVYPGTVVVPSTFLAASDSKWYVNLTDSIYKFSAIAVPLEEMKRFHGHDERISLENYENLINFYHHLIKNSESPSLKMEPDARTEL